MRTVQIQWQKLTHAEKKKKVKITWACLKLLYRRMAQKSMSSLDI